MTDWNQIVERNARVVVDAAFRIVGNSDDAEDIAQSVFLEAYTKWKATAENHWTGLLRQMAVRRAIDMLRKRPKTDPLPASLIDFAATQPEQESVARESRMLLRLSVAELPDREANVFCLVYFEGQTHDEVAVTLQMQKSAVGAALSRARAKLSRSLRPTNQEN